MELGRKKGGENVAARERQGGLVYVNAVNIIISNTVAGNGVGGKTDYKTWLGPDRVC